MVKKKWKNFQELKNFKATYETIFHLHKPKLHEWDEHELRRNDSEMARACCVNIKYRSEENSRWLQARKEINATEMSLGFWEKCFDVMWLVYLQQIIKHNNQAMTMQTNNKLRANLKEA